MLFWNRSTSYKNRRNSGSHPTFRTEEVGWAPALASGPKGLIAAQSPVEAPVEPWVLIPPLERRRWDGLRLSPSALKG